MEFRDFIKIGAAQPPAPKDEHQEHTDDETNKDGEPKDPPDED